MLNPIEEEMWFFIYLLEHYAAYKNQLTGDGCTLWYSHGITQSFYYFYCGYHTERIENAYYDIDSLIATGKHCY